MRYFSGDDVAIILSDLGYQDIRIRGDRVEARCQCSTKQDRSLRVMLSGRTPGYVCHRCHITGALEDLVWKGWASGSPVDRSLSIVSVWLIEQAAHPPVASIDYAPWSSKPLVKFEDGDRVISTGVQANMEGISRDTAKAAPLTEESLSRFAPGPDEYLAGRGFTKETQAAFDIMRDTRAHRVVFPIRGWDGEILSYSRRLTWSGKTCYDCGESIVKPNGDLVHKCKCGAMYAKYMHAKGFSLKEYMYGQWLSKGMTADTTPVIVEGMTDVMRLWQAGVRPPLALPLAIMGANLAETQIAKVLERVGPSTPVVMVCDNDNPADYEGGVSPGRVAAFKARMAVKSVSPMRPFAVVVPGEWKDPGDMTDHEIAGLIWILEGEIPDGKEFYLDGPA